MSALAVLSAWSASSTLSAQSSFELTIPNIMRGPEVAGRQPSDVRWSADSRWIYFTWQPPGTDWREPLKPYRVRGQVGAVPESVSVVSMDSVEPLIGTGSMSPDRRSRVVAYRGDLYMVSLTSGTARRLTETVDSETTPVFSVDGKQILFVRGNNAYAMTPATGLIRQLTDIRLGPAPKEDSTTLAQRKELEAEQLRLFEAIRDQARRDSLKKAEKKEREAREVLTLYLDKDETLRALNISPAGTGALVVTKITKVDRKETKVPAYVTKSGYTEELTAREKVGDVQDGSRVGFMSLPSGTIHWIAAIPDDTAQTPDETRCSAGTMPDGRPSS